MNAFKPSRPPLQPVKPRRTSPQRNSRQKSRTRPYRVIALETTAKLAVNFVLSVAAVTSGVQLLRYQWSQQPKLQEIQTEVKATEKRVERLQKDFSRNFDPQQAKNVMQEETNRTEIGQRQIILLDKAASKVEKPAR